MKILITSVRGDKAYSNVKTFRSSLKVILPDATFSLHELGTFLVQIIVEIETPDISLTILNSLRQSAKDSFKGSTTELLVMC